MTDRETLEQQAMQAVSAELYYDLADDLETATDEELIKIITCNGDYKKELEVAR